MPNKKAIIISAIFLLLFTDLLFCTGVFGSSVVETARAVSISFFKWTFIILGYCFCIFVPWRILVLLKKSKEIKKEINKDEEYRRITEENNKLIREIEESYYNPKDTF